MGSLGRLVLGLAGEGGFLRIMFKNGPVEFLLSVNEKKYQVKMKEGIVPVSSCPPGLRAMMAYCLFRSFYIFGELKRRGCNPN